jgi:hypothetical protein
LDHCEKRREEKREERELHLWKKRWIFLFFLIVNLSWQDFSLFTGLGLNRVQYIVCNFMYWKQFLKTFLTRGVSHCGLALLPFTLKSILRQKKNCGNSNISPCKDIIFKKIF